MKYKNIISNTRDGVNIITINRPKQLNALNKETILELSQEVTISNNNPLIRCIILTGSGEKAFVAGADIKEFVSFTKLEGEELAREGQELLFNLLENLETPTIAAINGFALGGGLELALSCHIRIASENAKMGLPEVSLGVIPGYGGTQRLTGLIGRGRAIEMITTARMISSQKAMEWGMLNSCCSFEELIPKAMEIALRISSNSPMAISKAIKSINAGCANGVDGYEVEINEFGSCFETDQFIEGTQAFLEKRKAKF